MTYAMMGLIQVLYVALYSIRSVFMIKGMKYLAAFISTIEIFVYITGLAIVLKYMDSTIGIIIYCGSYGIGILLGIYIEQKIALGYIALQVISEQGEMSHELRTKGYGVTTWTGQGAQGTRMVYIVLARRKQYLHLKQLIQQIDPKAFMVSYEPSNFVGGFWTKSISK
ncbi:DUF2179 domain-containing protein [Ammoniphilus sp. 3BR4]|uniref:DUF2179 domain-containing protein n=1 Tax=Ammoniphilus sp. 3BR4 TaxID=3158265 RepID=UPI003465DDE4